MRPDETEALHDETDRVRQRYARRAARGPEWRYDPLNPVNLCMIQERERLLADLLRRNLGRPAGAARLIEIGCGNGFNLLSLLRLGFHPENLTANELLEDRLAAARSRLPATVRFLPGDATRLDVEPGSQDVVFQSTVFSSLLDDDFQVRLAERMWEWVRPGGAVLWYDLAYGNPRNPDVRGMPAPRVRALFPQGRCTVRRVTLAPPLARRAPAALYGLLNATPLLRTHLLCWIAKPL